MYLSAGEPKSTSPVLPLPPRRATATIPAAQPPESRQGRADRFEVNAWSLYKLICSSRAVLVERQGTLDALQAASRRAMRGAVGHSLGVMAAGCGALSAGTGRLAALGLSSTAAATWALGGTCTVLAVRSVQLWRRYARTGRQVLDLRARQQEREVVTAQQMSAASRTLTLLANLQHGTTAASQSEVTAIGPQPPAGARARRSGSLKANGNFFSDVTPALSSRAVVLERPAQPSRRPLISMGHDWPSGTTYRQPH